MSSREIVELAYADMSTLYIDTSTYVDMLQCQSKLRANYLIIESMIFQVSLLKCSSKFILHRKQYLPSEDMQHNGMTTSKITFS